MVLIGVILIVSITLALAQKLPDPWTSALAAVISAVLLGAITLWRDGHGPMFLPGLLFVFVLYWGLATLIVYGVRKLRRGPA